MGEILRKFRSLQKEEQVILIQSLFLLPFVALALRLTGFRRCYSTLASVGSHHSSDDNARSDIAERRAQSVGRMVRIAADRGLYRANCLQRSLVIWWLLSRRGIKSELRIGARKVEGQLEAHAWVEFMGKTLSESGGLHQDFTSFTTALSHHH